MTYKQSGPKSSKRGGSHLSRELLGDVEGSAGGVAVAMAVELETVDPVESVQSGPPVPVSDGHGSGRRPRRWPDTLLAGRGYGLDKYRRLVCATGITPMIARRGG